MMDELEFPDFGGEVAPVARDEWQCGWRLWDPCTSFALVLGTELGLAIQDCEGVQVEISL